MKLEFNNLNPCLLLDSIIKNGISVVDVAVTSDVRENENIAQTVWVECKEMDLEKITELATNLDNTVVQQPTIEEQIQILKQENANLSATIDLILTEIIPSLMA